MRKQCPSCQKILDDATLFCPVCGTKQPLAENGNGRENHTAPAGSAAKFLTVALIVVCFGLFSTFVLPFLVYIALSPLLDMMSHFVGGVDLLGDTSPVLFGALMISRIGYLAFGILLLVKRNWKIALTIAAYSAVCLVFEWWVLDDSYSILVLLIAILCTIFLRKQGSFKL